MQFEYDPEQLINEVQKRPAIWNPEDPNYRAKHAKMKLWTEIVKELVNAADNSEISRAEMRELELQLQKKWKSLRDCFQKYVMNPHRSRRPYIFMKQLQFLLKDKEVPKSRKPTIKIGASESEDDDKPRHKWKRKLKLNLNMNDDESDDHGGNMGQEEYFDEIPLKPEPDIRNSIQVDQFAFANVDTQVRTDFDDTDKMFLLSLLPHLKSVPEEFRLNVKVELMNVLRTANENTSQLKYNDS